MTVIPTPVQIVGVSLQTVHLGKHGECKKTTQVIVLHFSGGARPGVRQNTNCYKLETIASGHKKSQVVALSQATYNPADNTVKLRSSKQLVFGPSLLLMVEGLHDSLGRPLDGQFAAILSKSGATMI